MYPCILANIKLINQSEACIDQFLHQISALNTLYESLAFRERTKICVTLYAINKQPNTINVDDSSRMSQAHFLPLKNRNVFFWQVFNQKMTFIHIDKKILEFKSIF